MKLIKHLRSFILQTSKVPPCPLIIFQSGRALLSSSPPRPPAAGAAAKLQLCKIINKCVLCFIQQGNGLDYFGTNYLFFVSTYIFKSVFRQTKISNQYFWFVNLSKVFTKVLIMKRFDLIKIKRIEWTSELFGGEIVNYGYNPSFSKSYQHYKHFNCAK